MSMCEKTHPHGPHFYARIPPGTLAVGDEMRLSDLTSCPGIDVPPLAPERDRPTEVEFDWTPEVLHLTNAAACVVRAHNASEAAAVTGGGVLRARYHGAMAVWLELTGMDEATALTYAYSIATLVNPATATPIPF